MQQVGTDFMPLSRQLIGRRLAEALSDLLGQQHSTAKKIAKAYRIDPTTAENLRKGHLSVPTLEKVVRAEGWALWAALGEELLGTTYEQHLASKIEETRRAHDRLEERRAVVRDLEARAAELVPLRDRLDS